MWLYKKERTRTNKYTKTIDHTSLVISTLGPLQKRKMVIHLQKKKRKKKRENKTIRCDDTVYNKVKIR